MQVLEKILEEIDVERKKQREVCKDMIDTPGYRLYEKTVEIIKGIIRRHMEGEDADIPTNNGWIPVNERLPEESGYYMTCIYNTEVDEYDFRTAWFKQKDEFDLDESEWQDLFGFEKVTGWNTLPEPCKLEEPKTVKNTQQELEDFWRDK